MSLVFIVLLIALLYVFTQPPSVEGFLGRWVSVYRGPKYCPDCGHLDRFECSRCLNCGVCWTPDGHPECVPGDVRGPYFRSDCRGWEKESPRIERHIFPTIRLRPAEQTEVLNRFEQVLRRRRLFGRRRSGRRHWML